MAAAAAAAAAATPETTDAMEWVEEVLCKIEGLKNITAEIMPIGSTNSADVHRLTVSNMQGPMVPEAEMPAMAFLRHSLRTGQAVCTIYVLQTDARFDPATNQRWTNVYAYVSRGAQIRRLSPAENKFSRLFDMRTNRLRDPEPSTRYL
jgi:hypothetical protein